MSDSIKTFDEKEESGKQPANHGRRNSIILALVLLAVFGAGWLIQHLKHGAEGPVAVIQYGGEIIERLDLNKDTSLVVGDRDGDYNIVRVQDGKVFVEEANCPDQICVYIGPISTEEEVIACLPHEMIIFIDENDEEDDK